MKMILAFAALAALSMPLQAGDCDTTEVPKVEGISPEELAAFKKARCTEFLQAVKKCDPKSELSKTVDAASCWKTQMQYKVIDSHPIKVPSSLAGLQGVADGSNKARNSNSPEAINHEAGKVIENRGDGAAVRVGTGGTKPEIKPSTSTAVPTAPNGVDEVKPDAKAGLNSAGAAANGPLKATVATKEDPNKWNDTIAGAKAAFLGALFGMIFMGPMGIVLCAAVGFGVGYFVHKMTP